MHSVFSNIYYVNMKSLNKILYHHQDHFKNAVKAVNEQIFIPKHFQISGDEIDLISLVSWCVNIPGLWLGKNKSIKT